MGRYLALGVVTTVSINAGKKFDLEKNKKKIEKELGRYLDLSKYDWKQKKNGFYLKIQVEHFNKNIHGLIKELYPLIDCEYFYSCHWQKKIDVLSKDFDASHYPIVLKQARKDDFRGEYYCPWNKEGEDHAMEDPEQWIFKDEVLRENIGIDFSYIMIWINPSKILLEDETDLLDILNTHCHSYYKNPLSKNILFYISG